jgi:DNA-binding SARP family transcriptional activator
MTGGDEVDIRVLGPTEIDVGDRSVVLGGPKQRALLAALVLGEGRVVSIDHLVDVLWDEAPPSTAITKIQGHVYALRKALAEAGGAGSRIIVTRSPGYVMPSASARIDLTEFDRLSDAARTARTRGELDRAADLMCTALALWRGAAFADVPALAIQVSVQRLTQRYLVAVEDKAEMDLELGRYRQVLDELDGILEAHPYRDRLREMQMVSLIRLDRRYEAIASYRRWRLVLDRDLGIEPCGRLRQLVASIGYRP